MTRPKQTSGKIVINPIPLEMTPDEKNQLRIKIGQLSQDAKKQIVPIVQEELKKNGENQAVFEFELDQLT